MHDTDEVMEELQKIKEECSLLYLSQTPEERRLHTEAVMERAEAALGRPIKTVNRSGRGKLQEEPARA
jgi:hypothetical protein